MKKRQSLRGKDGVYKRGGVWLAVVEYPRDLKTGKRTRVWTEGFATRREAEAERDRLRNEIRSGIDTVPEKITVGSLLDRWLSGQTTLAPKSAERYAGLIARVKPHIGSTLATKLRPAHIQECYVTLSSRCRTCTRLGNMAPKHKCKGGLSRTTVSLIHSLCKQVGEWGVKMQILARNPFAAVDAPQRAMPKTDAYTDTEISAILDAARSTRWDTAIMFALATGARCGEVMALRWDDILIESDASGAEHGVVTIRASFSQTKATGITLKTTKTDRVRSIPLSSLAIRALHAQRFRQAEDAFKAADGYAHSGFVFTGLLGQPNTPYSFSDGFRKIARRAGVHKRLHDARHTAASHLLAAGVDVRTAATILGHSSPQTTLTVYAHQLAGLKEDAISRLDGRLRAAIDKPREGGN